MRRIAVIGGASPLGRRVVARLAVRPEVELVRGIETRARAGVPSRSAAASSFDSASRSASASDLGADAGFDVVPFVPDPRPLAEFLEKEAIDTVVHANLVADRCGASAVARDADVIGAMSLGAAIGHADSPVRSWVVVSSSAIYPIGSQTALLHAEHAETAVEPVGFPASISEAEDYARETAARLPHVNVAILRLQQLAGHGIGGALARLLARDPVPTPAGFNPAIQLLHVEDAVEAIVHAVTRELAGIYNVASAGLIRFDEAVRIAGRSPRPLLPFAIAPVEPLLARLGLPFLPAELAALLRSGHAIDTAKLERTGWHPRFDQRECVVAVGDGASSGAPRT